MRLFQAINYPGKLTDLQQIQYLAFRLQSPSRKVKWMGKKRLKHVLSFRKSSLTSYSKAHCFLEKHWPSEFCTIRDFLYINKECQLNSEHCPGNPWFPWSQWAPAVPRQLHLHLRLSGRQLKLHRSVSCSCRQSWKEKEKKSQVNLEELVMLHFRLTNFLSLYWHYSSAVNTFNGD